MRDENELSPEVANFWFWRHYYKKMEEALETIKREEYDGAHKQLIEGKALTWKARTVLQKRGIPLSSSVLEEWNDMLLETEKLLVMLAGEEYELLAAYLEDKSGACRSSAPVPPAHFWFLFVRAKRNSPSGEIWHTGGRGGPVGPPIFKNPIFCG